MGDKQIVGLVTGWGVSAWIGPCIEQAIKYCDEVIVCIGTKSPIMEQFKDNTYEVALKYKDKIKLLKPVSANAKYTGVGTAIMLNYMLSNSALIKKDNWIWILDSDEFYTDESHNKIRELIEDPYYNHIGVEAKFFLIDMQHYIESYHERLFRITNVNHRFIPTQHWPVNKVIATLDRDIGMFHYSLLKNPNMRIFQWKHESIAPNQIKKIRWGNEIYKYYDLNNEEYWIDKNEKMFGIRSPFWTDAYSADKNGKLFVYKGKQPEFIENSDLINIKDFRKYYNFK